MFQAGKAPLKSKYFSRQNFFFQKTKEKFGGKKFTLQRNEVLSSNALMYGVG
jgi:hypothetical protein